MLGDNRQDSSAHNQQSIYHHGNRAAGTISGGFYHTCALLEGGTAKCWGANDAGQLGDNTTSDRLVPTPVMGLTGAISVASGGDHSCALLQGAKVRCWGNNGSGQLGDGTTTNRSRATAVVGI